MTITTPGSILGRVDFLEDLYGFSSFGQKKKKKKKRKPRFFLLFPVASGGKGEKKD